MNSMNLIIDLSDENTIYTDLLHIRDMLNLLSKIENFYVIKKPDFDIHKENLSKYVLDKYNKNLKNVISFGHITSLLQIKNKDFRLIAIFDDLHHQGNLKRQRDKALKKIDVVLSTYAYCFHKYFKPGKYQLYFFPHTSRYKSSYNSEPIEKVLISGRVNKEIYPKRFKAYNLSLNYNFIEYLDVNFNYRMNKDNTNDQMNFGKNFIKKLNQYLICFTCDASPDRPYILAKHFEILSSGALLLSANDGNTKKYFELLGFKDGEHYISCNIDNMQEKINYCLDPNNRNKIDRIRYNGYYLFNKNHTYEQRIFQFSSILNNSEEFTLKNDGINDTNYFSL